MFPMSIYLRSRVCILKGVVIKLISRSYGDCLLILDRDNGY